MAASNRYPRQAAVNRDYRRVTPQWDRTPANDNKPRPKPKSWIPANDNRPVPKPNEWSLSRPPKVPGWARWMRRLMRFAGPIGLALTAYEIYELYQWYRELRAMRGWTVIRDCSPPSLTSWQGIKVRSFNNATPACVVNPLAAFTSAPANVPYSDPRFQGIGASTLYEWDQFDPGAGPGGVRRHSERTRYTKNADPFLPPIDRFRPREEPRLPDFRPPPWEDPFVEPGRPLPRTPPKPRPKPDPVRPGRPLLPEDRVSEEPRYPPRPEFRGKPEPEPLPRRPRKRERERKLRIRDMPNKKFRRLLGWLISAASEGGDFLDIMYDALPDTLTSSDADTAEKFDTVFKNLDKVDFDKFVSELWQNEVQDRYFGKGFGDMTSALEEFGLELPSLKI